MSVDGRCLRQPGFRLQLNVADNSIQQGRGCPDGERDARCSQAALDAGHHGQSHRAHERQSSEIEDH